MDVVDTISPNFKLPTVWKVSLALDRELPWWGMIGSVEYQHTAAQGRDLLPGASTSAHADGHVA